MMKKIKAVLGGVAIVVSWAGIILGAMAVIVTVLWGVVTVGGLLGITEDGFKMTVGFIFAGLILLSIGVAVGTAIYNAYHLGFKDAWLKVWRS
jgi:hypothetical protein